MSTNNDEDYSWQQPAIQRSLGLLRGDQGIVANTSDTGIGKTYITAQAIAALKARAYVIAPLGVQTQWRQVLEIYGVSGIDIINIEKLRTANTKWYHHDGWHLPLNTVVVIDEAHKGSCDPKSKTAPMLARLKATGLPMVLQSATLADDPLKMRATGYLLGLHKFNPASFYRWCRQHACTSSPFHSGLEFSKGPRGRDAMAAINAALAPVTVRLRIADTPGFPECDTEATLFDLDAKYKKEVEAAYADMDAELKEPGVNELVEIQKARQRTELAKLKLLEDLIDDYRNEGKSVVVFMNFTAPLLELRRRKGGVLIYGQQSRSERELAKELFQDNKETLCIANCDAGGLGIDLHDVHHKRPRVALITPPWSATVVTQVLGRIHRAGGTRAQQVFVLAAGTVEERVHRAIKRKLGNLKALNDNDLRG